MIDAGLALEALALKQLLELTAEPVGHRKVKRAEIFVEWHVGEVLAQ